MIAKYISDSVLFLRNLGRHFPDNCLKIYCQMYKNFPKPFSLIQELSLSFNLENTTWFQ